MARSYLAESLPGRLPTLLHGENTVGPEREQPLPSLESVREDEGLAITRIYSKAEPRCLRVPDHMATAA